MDTEIKIEIPTESKPKLWSRGRLFCGVLALASLAVSFGLVYTLLANPFGGPRVMPLFLLMASSAVFVNRALTIPQSYLIPSRKLRLLAGAGKWSLTLIFPFFLVSTVSIQANYRTIEIAEAELSPVINFLYSEFNSQGRFSTDILEQVKFLKHLSNVTYFYDEDEFVIQTNGNSADIDGSTIFYSSSDKKLLRLHNDIIDAESTQGAKRYLEAINGLNRKVYGYYKNDCWEVYE